MRRSRKVCIVHAEGCVGCVDGWKRSTFATTTARMSDTQSRAVAQYQSRSVGGEKSKKYLRYLPCFHHKMHRTTTPHKNHGIPEKSYHLSSGEESHLLRRLATVQQKPGAEKESCVRSLVSVRSRVDIDGLTAYRRRAG